MKKNLIREQIDMIKRFNLNKADIENKQKIINNHIRLMEIFNNDNLNENDINNEKRDDVLFKIKNNDFEKHNPESFKEAISKSKHPLMLSDYSVNEFNQMKLFKLNGYDIGYALKKTHTGKYDEIVSVFNNEPNVKFIGDELIQNAVKNGGCFLDHFDSYLTDFYSKNGFVEVNREKYNPIYDTDGLFRKKYGKSDIIYRVHKNCLSNN